MKRASTRTGVATDNFQVYNTDVDVLPRPVVHPNDPARDRWSAVRDNGARARAAHRVADRVPHVDPGGASTPAALTWSTLNATTVSIDQGIGTVASSGSLNVLPTATTTYTLTATNAEVPATTTATATLTVTPPDNTPPGISGVASSSLTTTGATIGFTTNELAFHQVEYGLNALYGTSTALHSMLMESHSQALTGLTPGTVYHYRVRATDLAGNSSVSGNLHFHDSAHRASVQSCRRHRRVR